MSASEWTETWKENTSAFDRVRSISMTVSEPRTATWIAEQAHVAETTARDHLDRLVEMGIITANREGTTTYEPDPVYVRFREIRDLLSEYTHHELVEFIAEIKEDIEQIRDNYNVDTPQMLRESAAERDRSSLETRDRLQAASDWEQYTYRLSLLEEAVERYNDYTGQPSVVSS